MTRWVQLLPLLGAGCMLCAQNWEVQVSSGVQSPSRALVQESIDAYGQRSGRSFSTSSDFRQLSVGGSYNALSYGALRLRAGVAATLGGPSPDLVIRYLRSTGLQSYYAEASGQLKLSSVDPALTLVYVAPWAGEYGLGVEARMQKLAFDAGSVTKDIPGSSGAQPALSRSLSRTDPFLTLHAAFVQQYPDLAVFARFTLAFNLKSAVTADSFTEAQFGSLDEQLLGALFPRRDVKVSVGVRF